MKVGKVENRFAEGRGRNLVNRANIKIAEGRGFLSQLQKDRGTSKKLAEGRYRGRGNSLKKLREYANGKVKEGRTSRTKIKECRISSHKIAEEIEETVQMGNGRKDEENLVEPRNVEKRITEVEKEIERTQELVEPRADSISFYLVRTGVPN
jgi:hypothetical protein